MAAADYPHLLLCGYGYLGHAIARDFLGSNWTVTAVSRSKDGDQDHPLLNLEVADLSNQESITDLSNRINKPDFIVHCASSGRGGGVDAYHKVYVDGCRNLVSAFPNTPLLYTSSTSVYPQTDGSTVTEDSPSEPDRETGQLLREAEKIVLENKGLVFRLSGIYGPGRSVILKKYLNGESTLEEDGRRILNQIHRDDAASAIFHAAIHKIESGIYNVSDSSPRSQLETFKSLGNIFGKPMPPSAPRDPNRKRGWTHKAVSNEKLVATGWKPANPDFLKTASEIAATL